MILRQNNLKKAVTSLLVSSMLLSLGACKNSFENTKHTEYSLENIKLTESERSWSNPDEKYSKLVKLYGDSVCPGTLVVATDDNIIYLYAENELEKDGKTLESQDTIFDMASVSKTFTAVAVLQLVEKGKINLDDTLDKYFPEYETGKKITVYNLLHMRSGIPDYCNNPDPFWNISGAEAADKKLSEIFLDKISDEEFLQALYKAPLSFEPGTASEYSNTNYHLLAFIIEQVSGQKYCDYVKKNIFDKCGMTKTSSMAVGDMTYVPVGYQELVDYGFTDEKGYPAGPNNYRGDSGIHSCLTDMVKFDRALFGGKLLNKDSMEILLKNESGYCCGLMKENKGYSHSGSSFTCSTNNRIIESEEHGHIYIITLERNMPLPEFDIDNPMDGTNYTQGVFKDGIYTNEYAGLKMKIADGFEEIGEEDRDEMFMYAVNSASGEDKTRLLATKYDAGFWLKGETIHIYFFNRWLGSKDGRNYSEEDYLNDYMKYYIKGLEQDGLTATRSDIVKVTLGGKEYLRVELVMQTNDVEAHLYYYVRKLDDNLMVMIEADSMSDKRADYYEKLFIE